MITKTKRALSILLAVVLTLSLAPAFTPPVSAADGVAYIDENGDVQYKDGVTEISANRTGGAATLSTGWYLVTGTFTNTVRLTVSGDVHLILADGADVTVTGGIGVSDGNKIIQRAEPAHAARVPVPRKAVSFYGKAGVLLATVRAAPMGEREAVC